MLVISHRSIASVVVLCICLAMAAGCACAMDYYISTTGNDLNDGTTPATAWATLERSLDDVMAGDTVYFMPGVYYPPTPVTALSGSVAYEYAPITYKALGAPGDVVIDLSRYPRTEPTVAFNVRAQWRIIDGFEIRNGAWGIHIADAVKNVTIKNCVIHDMLPDSSRSPWWYQSGVGIWCTFAEGCVFENNVIYNIGDPADHSYPVPSYAIMINAGAKGTKIFNNTVVSSQRGIFGGGGFDDDLNEVRNNIFADIWMTAIDRHGSSAFEWINSNNCFWNNTSDYANLTPGPGQVDLDPLFVYAPGNDYRIWATSPCVDAGVDVELPFNAAAPDIGYFETSTAQGNVAGTVKSGTSAYVPGVPMQGATVTVVETSASMVTGADGAYDFALPEGTYTVQATYTGAVTAQATVRVVGGNTQKQDLALNPDATAGKTYFVKPTGSDIKSGLTFANAWKTITNGNGTVVAGDTVKVTAGTYNLTADGLITGNSGNMLRPITYQADTTAGSVIIDLSSFNTPGTFSSGFRIMVDGVVINNFEIRNGAWGVFSASGKKYNTVKNCVIHDMLSDWTRESGFESAIGVGCSMGSYNTFRNNAIYNIGDKDDVIVSYAVKLDGDGTDCKVINNTLDGAHYGVSGGGDGTVQIRNNIITNMWSVGLNSESGLPWSNSHNCFWINGFDLMGLDKGMGEIISDPLFIDADAHDYDLQGTSPCINTGIDVGLPFNGPSPDMGAYESSVLPGYITGTVTSGTQAYVPSVPLQGATVTILETGAELTTDLNGKYTTGQLYSGAYTVQVSMPGAVPEEATVNVGGGSTTTRDFQLNPDMTITGIDYYVSTTGSNGNDGLTPEKPWLTILNGNGIVAAGDTVHVQPGVYYPPVGNNEVTGNSGNVFRAITYKAEGNPGDVVIDLGNYGPTEVTVAFRPLVHGLMIDGFEMRNGGAGVFIGDGMNYITVKNCVIHDMYPNDTRSPWWFQYGVGILSSLSTRSTYSNNVFYNIGNLSNHSYAIPSWGIAIWAGNKSTRMLNNTFVNCAGGIYGGGAFDDKANQVRNNIFMDIWGIALQRDGSSSNEWLNSNNCFWNNTGNIANLTPGPGQVDADPAFVNAAAYDYHLSTGSPCIDAGINVGFAFNGSAPDIGAYEVAALATPVANLAELKGMADGASVQLTQPKVVTVSSTTFADGRSYIEEPSRTMGIKIVGGGALAIGDNVTLTGVLGTDANGERFISVSTIDKAAGAALKALGLNNRSVNLQPESTGLLLKVWGKVTYKGADYMYIDDGSGLGDGNAGGYLGIRVVLSGMNNPVTKTISEGDSVAVTGVAGKVTDGVALAVIRPRADADVIKTSP